MKRPRQNENDQRLDDRSDGGAGAMSPSMRHLILSFGEADSERIWDPDAYKSLATSLTGTRSFHGGRRRSPS